MKRICKTIVLSLILAVALLTAPSCARAYENAADGDIGGADNGYTGGAPEKGESLVDENLETNRKIIKNVNESVQTDKYDDFLSHLSEAVTNAGGYISSANYSGDNYFNEENLRRANLTVRIPADNLSVFTEKVDSIAVVTYYNESIVDVTNAYVDAESRIAVLEAEETALLDILKTSTTTSDALSVRTRLLDVQADLASLRAQKNSLDDRIAYSTVTINVSEVRRAVEQNPGFFAEVGGKFLDSLDDIGQGLRDLAVWFLGNILYLVLVAVLCVCGFVLVRVAIRKRKARNTSANADFDADSAE